MLADFFGGSEERAISFQTIWGAGGVDFELGTRSGTLINEDTVLQINTVYAAVSLIANTVSTLPISAYVRRDGAQIPFRPTPTWVQRPDIDFPDKAGFYSSIVTSLLVDGNAYIKVTAARRTGEIANLTVLNPTTVEAKRNGIGNVMRGQGLFNRGNSPHQRCCSPWTNQRRITHREPKAKLWTTRCP